MISKIINYFKMKFNKKIDNKFKAKSFIKDLVLNDLDYHFDTPAGEIFKGRLSELEIEDLQNRIDEIFKILDDPFKYSVLYSNFYYGDKESLVKIFNFIYRR